APPPTRSHPVTKASDSTVYYRLFPKPGPQFVVTGYKETIKSPEPAGALRISAYRESGPLALHRVRLAEAAVYFCARRDNKPCGVSRRWGTLQWVPGRGATTPPPKGETKHGAK
ncbi:hypothetical protein G0U57_016591, partial [Chelydra serpentina]